MKVRICPNCNHQNASDAWECQVCGETLSIDAIAELDDEFVDPALLEKPTEALETLPQEIICPKCGKANSGENRFCGNCGEEIVANLIPDQGMDEIELTDAEKTYLYLITQGLSNFDIAAKMKIPATKAADLREDLLGKLNASNNEAAQKVALESNLLSPSTVLDIKASLEKTAGLKNALTVQS